LLFPGESCGVCVARITKIGKNGTNRDYMTLERCTTLAARRVEHKNIREYVTVSSPAVAREGDGN